jgi:hypothetical protein
MKTTTDRIKTNIGVSKPVSKSWTDKVKAGRTLKSSKI